MKHIVCTFLLLLVMACQLPLAAQTPPPRFNPKRFQADMEQYIATEACLTPMEAARFFPLFREMEAKQRVLFDKIRSYGHTDVRDNAASLRAIRECDKADLQMKKLQQTYHMKFCKVLPPGKVLAVIKAEEKFHRMVFRKMAKRIVLVPNGRKGSCGDTPMSGYRKNLDS